MINSLKIVLATCVLSLTTPSIHAAQKWLKYQDPDTGITVTYPTGMIISRKFPTYYHGPESLQLTPRFAIVCDPQVINGCDGVEVRVGAELELKAKEKGWKSTTEDSHSKVVINDTPFHVTKFDQAGMSQWLSGALYKGCRNGWCIEAQRFQKGSSAESDASPLGTSPESVVDYYALTQRIVESLVFPAQPK